MPQVTPKARSLFDPRVERFLIADEGEVIVDEVAKHWTAISPSPRFPARRADCLPDAAT